MIALFTMGFSCEQLLSFNLKKGLLFSFSAAENQDKWRQKIRSQSSFFKGIFGQVPKVSQTLVVYFMFCNELPFLSGTFYDSIRTKNEQHVLLFVMPSCHKYLPIQRNYYFMVSIAGLTDVFQTVIIYFITVDDFMLEKTRRSKLIKKIIQHSSGRSHQWNRNFSDIGEKTPAESFGRLGILYRSTRDSIVFGQSTLCLVYLAVKQVDVYSGEVMIRIFCVYGAWESPQKLLTSAKICVRRPLFGRQYTKGVIGAM